MAKKYKGAAKDRGDAVKCILSNRCNDRNYNIALSLVASNEVYGDNQSKHLWPLLLAWGGGYGLL